MSAPPHLLATTSLWTDRELVPRDDCDVTPARLLAADSWLVADGAVRGLDLHRERFLQATARHDTAHLDVDAFARYLAAQDVVQNWDDIDGPGNNSYLRWDETILFAPAT